MRAKGAPCAAFPYDVLERNTPHRCCEIDLAAITEPPDAEPKPRWPPPGGFSVWPAGSVTHLPRTPYRTPISAHCSIAHASPPVLPNSRTSASPVRDRTGSAIPTVSKRFPPAPSCRRAGTRHHPRSAPGARSGIHLAGSSSECWPALLCGPRSARAEGPPHLAPASRRRRGTPAARSDGGGATEKAATPFSSQHTTSPSIRQERTLRWFTASTTSG